MLITAWLCWRFPDVRYELLERLGRIFETPLSAVRQDARDQPVDSSTNLEIFAAQLAECSEPGVRIREFIRGQQHSPPVVKLINLYQQIRSRWQYAADVGQQHQSSEYSVKYWVGDCEDFACCVCAALKAADDITTRLVLCYGPEEDLNRGHAYAEALIAKDIAQARPILARLGQSWGLQQLSYRADPDGIWVALDFTPPHDIYLGQPYAYIYSDGRVIVPT